MDMKEQAMDGSDPTVKDTQTGPFIVIEGINGSGKTTVSDAVVNKLRQLFEGDVHLLKDHSSAPDNPAKRVLDGDLEDLTDTDLAVAYTWNRWHLWNDIAALISEGAAVVCDRWWPSTVAYQSQHDIDAGTDNRTNLIWLQQALNIGVGDLTILLDIPWETHVQRMADRGDRSRIMGRTQFEEVRQTYLTIAEAGRVMSAGITPVIVIDASGPLDMVTGKVTAALDDWWIARKALGLTEPADQLSQLLDEAAEDALEPAITAEDLS